MRLDLFIKRNIATFLEKSGLSDSAIKILADLPRSFWQKEINLGNVKFKNKIAKPSINIDVSKKLLISFDWKNIKNNWNCFYEKKLVPSKINLKLITTNSDYLAVNKPAGIVVHPAFPLQRGSKKEPSLIEGILYAFPDIANIIETGEEERPGIVHRLDKNTSGAILISRNLKTQRLLKNQFKDRTIKKTYFALVEGDFPYSEFEISSLMGKTAKNPMKIGVNNLKINVEAHCASSLLGNNSIKLINPKPSVTKGEKIISGSPKQIAEHKFEGLEIFKGWVKYLKLDKKNKYSFLRLFPETGRTHQIRVHLSAIGFPVIGDSLYGDKKNHTATVHCLHSYKISWLGSSGKRCFATADRVILF